MQADNVSVQPVGLVIAEIVSRDPSAKTENFTEGLRVLLTKTFMPLLPDTPPDSG